MRLAFTLEYDGTDFSGFQLQKNAITIQEHLEKAIKEITATDIKINYSGRTDAGVHAISQVFDFETEIQRDDNSWIRGINSNLPKSIAVKHIFHVPTDFNSRFSALERRYAYVIYNSTNKPLFFDKFSHWITNEIDLDEMQTQLEMFLGEHNFTSFRSSSCNSKNPIKKVTFVDMKTIDNSQDIKDNGSVLREQVIKQEVNNYHQEKNSSNLFSISNLMSSEEETVEKDVNNDLIEKIE